MKKTRFLATLLVLLCCIGCFAFAGCKEPDAEGDTTVTEEEWNAAFADETHLLNAEGSMTYAHGDEVYRDECRSYNDVAYSINYCDGQVVSERYYQGDYEYQVSGVNVTKVYKYGNFRVIVEPYFAPPPFSYDEFTYDSEAGSYKASELTEEVQHHMVEGIGEWIERVTYADVEIKFLNKALVAVSYTATSALFIDGVKQENPEGDIATKVEMTYGTVQEMRIPAEWEAMEIMLGENEEERHLIIVRNENDFEQMVWFALDATEIELPDGSKIPFVPGSETVTLPDGTVCDVHVGAYWEFQFSPIPSIPSGYGIYIPSEGGLEQWINIPLDATEIVLPDGTVIPFTPGQETVTLPDGTVVEVITIYSSLDQPGLQPQPVPW